MTGKPPTNALEILAAAVEPISIGIFLLRNFPFMTFGAALDPLRQANRLAGRTVFKWTLISIDGAGVMASAGVIMPVDSSIDTMPHCDLVLVCAGLDHASHYNSKVFAWLRRLHRQACVLGAISTGPFLLARAGLLDGRRCAVHWEQLPQFQEEFPNCIVTNEIFAIDGLFITSSGGTVTLDMMLYIIAACRGRPLAAAISDQFNHPEIRQEHDFQRMKPQSRFSIRHAKLAEVIMAMENSIQDPVDLQVLARRIQISTRQMERLFLRHLGKTPSDFYTGLRMARARDLILQTDLSISTVAQICGYMSSTHFGRTYRTHFGVTPREMRSEGILPRK
jgi:transcriptional regulator GlxA family with amidase domain